MKVAILIVGEYRTFAHCRKTMSFLDQPDLDADVYFSTWDQTNTLNPVSRRRPEWSTYEPVCIPVTEEQIRKDIGMPVTCAVHTQKYSGYPPIIDGWCLGFDLIKKSGKTYDYVLMLRPDLFFDVPTTLFDKIHKNRAFLLTDLFEEYNTAIGVRNAKFVPETDDPNNIDHYLVDDTMFFSSYENLEQLTSDKFKKYFNATLGKKNWHQMLFWFIISELKLDVLPWPMRASSAIARYPIDENSTYKVVEKQWWDWFRENN